MLMCHSRVNSPTRQIVRSLLLAFLVTAPLLLLPACTEEESTTSVASATAPQIVMRGLYVAADHGEIGVLELEDETHYRLQRQETEDGIESGVYELKESVLTLTNDQTKASRSFGLSVIETEKESADTVTASIHPRSLVGGGTELIVEGSTRLLITKVALRKTDGGTSQDLVVAGGPTGPNQTLDSMGGKLRSVECKNKMSLTGAPRLWCWKLVN
jgi:hypothetical protein